ncbi:MAG: metal-dependent hydrolase [Candidatus Poribacteria bacterium]|nr:metal-dependent hydrolase [Candidatus Poribacteria bacterium]
MTSFTHAAVGLGIAAFFPDKNPLWAVGFSLLPDLDHLLFIRTMRLKVGGMKHARTFLHELLGTVVYMLIGLGIALFDWELGVMFVTCLGFHLFCDFINGYSTPYKRIRDLPSIDMGTYLPTRVFQEVMIGGLAIWLFMSR